jgi:pimeloyl-ACP methyl ester carboxylesterase
LSLECDQFSWFGVIAEIRKLTDMISDEHLSSTLSDDASAIAMNRRRSLWMMTGGAVSLLAGTAGLGIGPRFLSRFVRSETRGFQLREWTGQNGDSRKYFLFIPYHADSSGSFPVILFLNGYGENGLDGRMQVAENFGIAVWEMKERFPFVIVAPQCRPDGSWSRGSSDVDAAFAILDDTAREIATDADRVYLTGVSSGGSASWTIAAKYPDRFAALVPIASSTPRNGDRKLFESLAAANLPIWAFYNRFDDIPGVVSFNQRMQQDLLELGQSPLVTDYPDMYHNCWDRAYRTPALYAWLLNQRRSQNKASRRRFSLVTEKEFALFAKHGGSATWDIAADHGVTCSATDSNSDCYLLSPGTPQELELNCEVLIEADGSPALVLRAWPQTEGGIDGWKLILSRAESGSAGIVSLDGRRWLATCDPIAQRQLVLNAWSDVRIRISDKRLSVLLNGYPAIDGVPAKELARAGCFGLAWTTPRQGIAGKWRRIRTIASSV